MNSAEYLQELRSRKDSVYRFPRLGFIKGFIAGILVAGLALLAVHTSPSQPQLVPFTQLPLIPINR